jgi:hypothetical protein
MANIPSIGDKVVFISKFYPYIRVRKFEQIKKEAEI